MLIVVVADTHGSSVPELAREIKKLGVPDYLLFAGDHYRDGIALAKMLRVPSRVVAGNCDGSINASHEEVFVVGGVRILLTHGHRYRVKTTMLPLKLRAEEVRADVVVFGHTHVAGCENVDGIWYVNPGSPSFPRNQHKSIAILEIGEDGIRPRIVRI